MAFDDRKPPRPPEKKPGRTWLLLPTRGAREEHAGTKHRNPQEHVQRQYGNCVQKIIEIARDVKATDGRRAVLSTCTSQVSVVQLSQHCRSSSLLPVRDTHEPKRECGCELLTSPYRKARHDYAALALALRMDRCFLYFHVLYVSIPLYPTSLSRPIQHPIRVYPDPAPAYPPYPTSYQHPYPDYQHPYPALSNIPIPPYPTLQIPIRLIQHPYPALSNIPIPPYPTSLYPTSLSRPIPIPPYPTSLSRLIQHPYPALSNIPIPPYPTSLSALSNIPIPPYPTSLSRPPALSNIPIPPYPNPAIHPYPALSNIPIPPIQHPYPAYIQHPYPASSNIPIPPYPTSLSRLIQHPYPALSNIPIPPYPTSLSPLSTSLSRLIQHPYPALSNIPIPPYPTSLSRLSNIPIPALSNIPIPLSNIPIPPIQHIPPYPTSNIPIPPYPTSLSRLIQHPYPALSNIPIPPIQHPYPAYPPYPNIPIPPYPTSLFIQHPYPALSNIPPTLYLSNISLPPYPTSLSRLIQHPYPASSQSRLILSRLIQHPYPALSNITYDRGHTIPNSVRPVVTKALVNDVRDTPFREKLWRTNTLSAAAMLMPLCKLNILTNRPAQRSQTTYTLPQKRHTRTQGHQSASAVSPAHGAAFESWSVTDPCKTLRILPPRFAQWQRRDPGAEEFFSTKSVEVLSADIDTRGSP
ncbi:hypothetical protein C7M84_001309 [Penaeus vannamei]|uniref:Uncharacterized protein n=1 Tax=Penaeus vannamei TaxID=6689 RepID=A0A3R7PR24_PENVA|nr:hypothetical protein C7M84_001309 [Penaeus vannamei]